MATGKADRPTTFHEFMRRRQYSRKTMQNYERKLLVCERWLAEGGSAGLRSASADEVEAYAEECVPLTHASRSGFRAACVAYWTFTRRKDAPVWAIKVPKRARMVCKALEDDEIDAVLDAARRLGPQVYAAVCLMYYVAFRREDVATVQWSDVADDEIHVVGKGLVEATLPLHAEAAAALRLLTRKRGNPYVFPGRPTWGQVHTHMSPAVVNYWIKLVAAAAGIDPTKLWPHRLRHTALAVANDETGDLRTVQHFARHADPRTTAGYTRATGRKLNAVVSSLSRTRGSLRPVADGEA